MPNTKTFDGVSAEVWEMVKTVARERYGTTFDPAASDMGDIVDCDALLVFEINCHGFSPALFPAYCLPSTLRASGSLPMKSGPP